jgi:adenosine A3 receptor, putative
MGIYLVTIAVHDYAFRDQYVNHALKWMESWQCHFCGFLATLSSELSILIVTLITVERYRAIRMKSRLIIFHSTKLIIVPVWIISVIIATFPLLYWSSEDDVRYYASNGVCFPLHIEDPFMSGWQFSLIVFLGVNFPAVMINIYLYTRLFITIRKDREVTRPALPRLAKREDIVLAFRFFCIVLTDCLCWLPIIIIKIVAFADVPISCKSHFHLFSN